MAQSLTVGVFVNDRTEEVVHKAVDGGDKIFYGQHGRGSLSGFDTQQVWPRPLPLSHRYPQCQISAAFEEHGGWKSHKINPHTAL